MDASEVERQIREYIVAERLGGDGAELTADTPLLEWGVLDSLSVVELMTFVEQRFGITVPPEQISAPNLQSLTTLSALVLRLRG
jgi:acyl carrier protein